MRCATADDDMACRQADMFPFVEGAYLSLNNAFDWGEKHGVGIWVDFHAHNGSQNG